MKYVVTGGAGFIGSNLVDKLIAEGSEVHVIDNFSSGKKDNCNKKAKYYNLDLSNSDNCSNFIEILNGVDTVFHTAAIARVQPSISDPINYEKNNTIGLVNILKSSVDAGVKRFVYSSSSSVYGNNENLPLKETEEPNPLSPYGAQKLYGETMCKTFSEVYGIETVCLRYFNVYGEKQNIGGAYSLVIGIFINQKMQNLPLTIRGDGSQKRDFTYVGDVVEANILASKSKKVGKGESINIGRGKSISINELAEMISNNHTYIDSVLEPKENLADNEKAYTLLGWKPKIELAKWIMKKNYNSNK
tara:strand:- start:48878 stop:49786 length:909 start_codon:yes stop_codon:yes gene_type:complete